MDTCSKSIHNNFWCCDFLGAILQNLLSSTDTNSGRVLPLQSFIIILEYVASSSGKVVFTNFPSFPLERLQISYTLQNVQNLIFSAVVPWILPPHKVPATAQQLCPIFSFEAIHSPSVFSFLPPFCLSHFIISQQFNSIIMNHLHIEMPDYLFKATRLSIYQTRCFPTLPYGKYGFFLILRTQKPPKECIIPGEALNKAFGHIPSHNKFLKNIGFSNIYYFR